MSDAMDRPITVPWWRKKPWVQAGAGAAGLALFFLTAAAFLAGAERSLRVNPDTITLATVQHDVFHDFVPLRGKTVPRDTIYLDALEGGQVEHVLVQAGDHVEANQPLVVFRNSQLELEVLDQVGRLVESITQLQTYETQLETNRANNEKSLAEIDYNILRLQSLAGRQDPLAAKGVVSAQQAEQTHQELDHYRTLRPLQADTNRKQEDLRRKQLPQVQVELDNLQRSLAITRNKLDDLTVKAPVAGQVTAINLMVGENRNRGDRLAEIVPATGYKVFADIDEFYRGRVKPAQRAEAEIDETDYALRVTRIYPQVQNGVFTAELEFEGAAPAGLVPGAAIQGRLSLGSDNPALIIPAGAFLERTGGDWILVVDAGGESAHRRQIKVGRRNVEQLEIVAGLKAGERVITSDYTGYERIERIDFVK